MQENNINTLVDGQYSVYGASGIISKTDTYQFDTNGILVLKDGSKSGKIQYAFEKYSVIGTSVVLIPKDKEDAKFLYFALLTVDFSKYKVGSGIPHIYFKDYSKELLFYPQKEERKRIVQALSSLEEKINKEKEMLSALKKQKAFLLKNMFI